MAKYIEREKVLELIGNFKRDDVIEHCEDYAAGWNEALEQIECSVKEDIFVHDVRPEKRGKWQYNESAPYCSYCGGQARVILPCPCYYCPNCGAKMDGNG